jgi:hypothetical protein
MPITATATATATVAPPPSHLHEILKTHRDLTAGFRDELIDATQTPMRVPAPWHSMRLRPCWPRNTIVAPARPAGLPQSTMNKIRSDLRVILIGGSSHSRRKVDAIEIAG